MPEAIIEQAAPVEIPIDGDTLITDEEFCRKYLNGATRRTAGRYDHEGLPFVMVNNRKMRPVRAGSRMPARG
jgi:hypothetical protein